MYQQDLSLALLLETTGHPPLPSRTPKDPTSELAFPMEISQCILNPWPCVTSPLFTPAQWPVPPDYPSIPRGPDVNGRRPAGKH